MKDFTIFITLLLISTFVFGKVENQSLYDVQYKPLKTGSVQPQGWLLKQLSLQSDGLAGHLSYFWNDIMNSIWIGGSGDDGLHERVPYWLNGLVPLAYLLNTTATQTESKQTKTSESKNDLCTEGVDMPNFDILNTQVQSIQECHDMCVNTENCVGFVVDDCQTPMTCWLKHTQWTETQTSCRCWGKVQKSPVVNLKEQVNKYVSYIISHQDSSGQLGPITDSDGDMYWGRSDIILSLIQYAEAEPTMFNNVSKVILNYFLFQKQEMQKVQMIDWSKARWIDMALAVAWLIENAPQGHEADLLQLAQQLHDQGSDWDSWFVNFQGDAGNHNVNNAQGLKSAAVWYRFTGSQNLHTLSLQRMDNLDRVYGIPTGMFLGDELLPNPPTRHPSRGIELCGVVEAMFSYNIMFSVFGDVAFADRVERIAYNALPATWSSPTGGDMWAHQYLQAVNEINSMYSDPHLWQNDGPDAELYGLEPNYGCCTANHPQGWPKFANMIVFTTQDSGAAIGAYAPVIATMPSNIGGGATINIQTDYPFSDLITIVVQAQYDMPLYLRVPTWATAATINQIPQANGTMVKYICHAGSTTFSINLNPNIRVEKWQSYSIMRGPLLYSLPLGLNFTLLNHYYGDITQSNDYQILPTSAWNYALDVDPTNPEDTLKFVQGQYQQGSAPFNHTNYPQYIFAQGRQVSGWGVQTNSADMPPDSPACSKTSACGSTQNIILVPHGQTDLRIGEFPLSYYSMTDDEQKEQFQQE